MKIAYICRSYPPMISGAALVAQRLAEGMVERGHTVLVIAASDRQRVYVDGTNGLRLARLRSFSNPMRVGQRFVLWPRKKVAAQFGVFCPDVLHLQDSLNLGLCGLHIAHDLGIPVVLTVHQLPWFVSACVPALSSLRQGIERTLWNYASWLLGQCEAVITPSHTIADIVSTRCNRRPQVISNGVDIGHFSPCSAGHAENEALCQTYGLDPSMPIILHVGRLDADKRVDLVVRAAAQAMRLVSAQLLVVGDGKRRMEVTRLSEELDIQDRCCFPGFVSQTGDLPRLYRLASVFVTASEIEIQSSVVLEAAATGLPIIAVRASSMPEFVQDSVAGYLVPPRDIDAMANRLVLLLQNPIQANAMGTAGRAMMEKHLLGHSIRAHEQLYRSLVACRAPE